MLEVKTNDYDAGLIPLDPKGLVAHRKTAKLS